MIQDAIRAVGPSFDAVSGTTMHSVVGALLTIVLVASVATLVVSAITWALSESNGNYHLATRARTGLLVALGTAAVAGAAIAYMNWLLRLGPTL